MAWHAPLLPGAVLAIVLGGEPATSRALEDRQPPPPQEAFPARVDLIKVDVVVVDRSGAPVRDLRASDFELLEEGKPQQITSFSAVDIASEPGTDVPAPDLSGTPTGSNELRLDGRLLLLVLDDRHMSAAHVHGTHHLARRLIQALGPADVAAVVATSGRSWLACEFTHEKARLLRVIDGLSLFFAPTETESSSVARVVMGMLGDLAERLASVEDRRKSIVFFSGGLALPVDTLQDLGETSQVMQTSLHKMLRANVSVYTIDPLFTSNVEQDDGLRTIGTQTGGVSNLGVESIVRESGTYYLLGYTPDPAPVPGKFRRISVQVRRPGVEVRARKGYALPRDADAPDVRRDPIMGMLASLLQTQGLPLRAAAWPGPSDGPTGATIVVSTEIDVAAHRPVDAAASEMPDIELGAIATDQAGKIVASDRFRGQFRKAGRAGGQWLLTTARLDVKPGRYQVRIAALDHSSARQGSVFLEVDVPDFANGISMSGIALGLTTPGVAARRERVQALLPIAAIAGRDISRTMPLAAFVRIRTKARKIPPAVTVTTNLRTAGGSEVFALTRQEPGANFSGRAGGGFLIPLPLTDLAAGEYILRMGTSLPGEKPVDRELRFTIG